jgi:hypothetical protein
MIALARTPQQLRRALSERAAARRLIGTGDFE